MRKRLVSVIIVARNRRVMVLDCLESVFKSDYPSFEAILVDNASSDGTVAAVKNQFPQVKIASSRENLGLNGGKNLGQKQAKGDYILFLDSDTIIDRRMVSELVNLAESGSSIGIVTPKIYFSDPSNLVWYAGANINLLTSRTTTTGFAEKDGDHFSQIVETEFAPTAFLVKKDLAEKLRGHDEIFFMTYGDSDYGFRAKKFGYRVVFCPTAKLTHRVSLSEATKNIRGLGFTSPMRAYYFARNRVIFMKRHAPRQNFIIFMLLFFPVFTLYFVYKIIVLDGGGNFLRPYLHGVYDGLRYSLGGKVKNIYV